MRNQLRRLRRCSSRGGPKGGHFRPPSRPDKGHSTSIAARRAAKRTRNHSPSARLVPYASGVSESRAPNPKLEEAFATLAAGVDALRSLGLAEEAADVAAVVERLGTDRTTGHNVFRREGEYWLILYETDVFRLRRTLGLAYLARLLANPGREIHVLDLVGSDPSLASDAGPLLDAEARRAYRERLEELVVYIAQAEQDNDPERAAACRVEAQLLQNELARGEGLGGRERAAGSASERARQAATKALKSTLARIAAESPALSRHLASTVRTGTYCRYDPDPRVPITWRL